MKTLLLSLTFSLSINYLLILIFYYPNLFSFFPILVHIIIILFPFFILLSFFIIRFYHLNFIYTFCEKFESWIHSIIKIQNFKFLSICVNMLEFYMHLYKTFKYQISL
uniref:Uncharacterized protein n=1 Tax=Cacopsylla melanoneura TaxID=428564 RepID=A0A8D9E3P8_9HEMI